MLKRIAKSPEKFYVNVHNAAYPDGAIRGQLGLAPKPALDLRRAAAEVGGRVDPAVEARPGLARAASRSIRSKLPSLPPRLPIAARASPHGSPGPPGTRSRSCRGGDDDVEHGLGEVGLLEALDRLDLVPDEVVAERLALQAAGVCGESIASGSPL